jgi:hypothetical protein
MTDYLRKMLDVAAKALQANESIVRITLGEPEIASHADFFTRYKVTIGVVDSSQTGVTQTRCIVVKISSNSGAARVDPATACAAVPDIPGLP